MARNMQREEPENNTGMDSFERIASQFIHRVSFPGVLFANISSSNLTSFSPDMFNATGLIIHMTVTGGTMEITADNIRYRCSRNRNNLIAIKPINSIGGISFSESFRGTIAILTRQFMDIADSGIKPIPFADVLSQRNNIVSTRSTPEMKTLTSDFRQICEVYNSAGMSMLDTEIFKHAVLLYHMKIVRMIQSVTDRDILSRSACLFEKFFRLLDQNVTREHSVSFYADKLCITPHYLTMISKENTGKPALRLIAEEVVTRAIGLLRNPELTVQEISGRLNFSDQSSFGKFFRKHTGKSPAAYRKEEIKGKKRL